MSGLRAMFLCSVLAAAVSDAPRGGEPLTIRFGVIEPPVVSQVDITIRAAVSNEQTIQLPMECSGLAWANGYLLFSSDRHGHVVFASKVDFSTMSVSPPEPMVVIANEQKLLADGESLTLRRVGDKWYGYVMCSMSNDIDALPLPKRRHLLRFSFDDPTKITPLGSIVIDLTPVRETLRGYFDRAHVTPYETFNADAHKNTYRWANTEGIAFVPGSDPPRLLCGMRNPLYGGRAMFYTLDHVNDALDVRNPDRIVVADIFTLDLGGRGVSDLCWDPVTRGYLITAALSNGPKLDNDRPFPPDSLDSALFWWSGVKAETPVLIARVPDMKIEAITRIADGPYIAIASDEGDVSEGRSERQSVLTIMEFTGFKR
ncbi:MAG: hypothetical protein GC162_10180 [Planctomycetes bacterium]|nr:hypothetical protein [Planctomycetota bacterium]